MIKFAREEANERLSICRGSSKNEPCEYYFRPTGSCKKCGCFVRLKTRIANQSCPINKW